MGKVEIQTPQRRPKKNIILFLVPITIVSILIAKVANTADVIPVPTGVEDGSVPSCSNAQSD